MIRVNLLPPEYRKAEATPAKQFFALLGAVGLALFAAVVWGWVYMKLQRATSERDTIKAEVDAQATKLQDLKDLEAIAKEYKTQYETIEKAATDRLILSQKLDQLWEVLVTPPQGKYDVWIKDLTMEVRAAGGKVPTGGQVKFGGISAGSQFQRFTDWHETLTQSEFFQDFIPRSITQPYGSRESLSKDREPAEGWRFEFVMSLKPLKDVYADRAKAKAGEPK